MEVHIYATLGGTIFSAFLGVAFAYMGFGVWTIVAQQLSNTTIDTSILWLTVKWCPQNIFSWEQLKGLLSYGGKLLVSALLDTGHNNIRSLITGKIYSSADLAYNDQGKIFQMLLSRASIHLLIAYCCQQCLKLRMIGHM